MNKTRAFNRTRDAVPQCSRLWERKFCCQNRTAAITAKQASRMRSSVRDRFFITLAPAGPPWLFA